MSTEHDEPSGASNAECLEFMTLSATQSRRVAEESGVRRALIKRSKETGVPTWEAQFVERLSKLDRDEAVRRLRNIFRLSALRRIIEPTQLDMLAGIDLHVPNQAREQFDLAQAEDRGYRAGKSGASTDDNPFTTGSESSVTWTKWRLRGLEAKAREDGAEVTEQAVADREQPEGRGAPDEDRVVSINVKANGHKKPPKQRGMAPMPKRPRGRPRKDRSQTTA